MHDAGDDPISLSFIDCISCGLAAAVFLFLVFAAIPRAASTAQAELADATGGGQTGTGLLPPLFDGTGTDVPVDIRIVLDRPVAENEARWKRLPAGVEENTSSYKPVTGGAAAFLGTFRSHDAAPTFFLDSPATPRKALGGTITIKAGPDTAPTTRFECPETAVGDRLTLLTFEGGSFSSDCVR